MCFALGDPGTTVLRERAVQQSLELPPQGQPVHGGAGRGTPTGYILRRTRKMAEGGCTRQAGA